MKQISNQPSDPANPQAVLDKALKAQAAMATQSMLMLNELYPPDMFGSPTVYVVEKADRELELSHEVCGRVSRSGAQTTRFSSLLDDGF